MRPTDRLFQIIQILRGSTGPVTAAALAEELKVSKRTIYRDIADLIGQRIPIEEGVLRCQRALALQPRLAGIGPVFLM